MEPALRHISTYPWLSFLLIGCFILLAIAKHLYPYRFQEFIVLPITNKYFLVEGRSASLWHPFNIILTSIQLVSFSVLIYLYYTFMFTEKASSNPWLFVQIITILSVFIGCKALIEKIIATIFGIETIVASYLYYKVTYRNSISLFVLVWCILFNYTMPLNAVALHCIIAGVVFFNAISLYYSYKTFRNLIFPHFFHFILYLCTLEISPYIILYKTLIYKG